MNLINPDVEFRGDAIKRAIEYMQWRVKDMCVGLPTKVAGPKVAAWFFNTAISSKYGKYQFDSRQNKVIMMRDKKLGQTLEF